VHDVALREERAFVDVVGSLAAMAFASDRVAARTAGMLSELEASRSRISAAADDERRRIERDLHDGAQQRLIALRVQLQLSAEQAGPENPAEAARWTDSVTRSTWRSTKSAHWHTGSTRQL